MGLFDRKRDDDDRAKAVAANHVRALTASAQRMKLDDKKELDRFRQRKSADTWQTDAWEIFDAIGEIKYSGNLIGAVLSRVRLYPAYNVDPDQAPAHVNDAAKLDTVQLPETLAHDADRVLRRLDTANGGASGILNRAGVNIWVAGECYLVQEPAKEGSKIPERWDIKSVDELLVSPTGKLSLKKTRNARVTADDELPEGAFAGRIWRSHPRFSEESDSSLRSVRDLADELLLLGRLAKATMRSRLNAGALFVPDELSLAADVDEEDVVDSEDPEDDVSVVDDDDEFERELIDAMTTPIADEESAAAVVPLIIRGPSELGEKIRHISFERSFDTALGERAEKVLERLMQGIDIPKDVIAGFAAVKYCVDSQTQVLSRRGWLSYDELQTTDDVYTLNPTTGMAEWQPVLAVNIFDAVDEPMFTVNKVGHSSNTTLNHRWLVHSTNGFELKLSSNLSGVDKVPVCAPAADLPVEPKYSDDLVELVAWFYTEGCYKPPTTTTRATLVDHAGWEAFFDANIARTGRIGNADAHTRKVGRLSIKGRQRLADKFGVSYDEVSQFYADKQHRRWMGIAQCERANPQHVMRIRAALTRLFGPATPVVGVAEAASLKTRVPTWNERRDCDGFTNVFMLNDEAASVIAEHVSDDGRKVVNPEFIFSLTRAQLELFAQVSSWADGCGKSLVGSVFGQKDEARQETFELVCHLLGLPITRRSNENGWYDCRVRKRTTVNMTGVRTTYTGVVWCPTTANGTWFARRGTSHYFTGNSNAVHINEQLYKAHIEPLVLLICDALTAVYYRPALLALGYDLAFVAKSMIWYDPSEILTRPDRAESSNQGYDRKVLAEHAWRKANGYSEADAPTPEEKLTRAVLERGPVSPELAIEVFKLLAPTLLAELRSQSLASSPVEPLSQEAQDVLDGEQPPANPALQPSQPPGPPTPTQPAPVSPAPPVPTPVGLKP